MGVVDPFNIPSSDLVTCSDNFRFNPNYVNISLPKIISYLPSDDSSTRNFHVTTFVALNAGKVKYTLTLILVVTFLAYACHCTT